MLANLNSLQNFTQLSNICLLNGIEAIQCLMTIPIDCDNRSSAFIEIDNLIRNAQAEENLFTPSLCLLQSLRGPLEGFLLFFTSLEASTIIAENLAGFTDQNLLEDLDFQQSIMNEWANIFTGNMMTALINKKQDNYIKHSVTEQTYDMKSAALDFVICQMALKTDLLAVCHGKIKISPGLETIDVWMIFNPESELIADGGAV